MRALTRRQFSAAALSALCALTGLTGCTDIGTSETAHGSGSASVKTPAPDSDTLRIGVRSDIVGFGYLNEQTNKYYGMEIELANDLVNRLGYKGAEFVTVTPDNRKEMLLEGKVDALIACYSIADSRLENFDFSPAYYDDEVIAVVQDSSLVNSIYGLKGLTFGTMSGSNAAPLLSIKPTTCISLTARCVRPTRTTPTSRSMPGACCSFPPTRSFPMRSKRAPSMP